MKHIALWAASLFLVIPLAGCMDPFGGDDYEPRTHEIDMVINAGTSTISLYTLNDGSSMDVVAITFETTEQEEATVPNPEIRVKEGDTVILNVINNNRMPHTFHFHGGLIPWEMDGVPYLTQEPIHQGESYTYIFEDLKAGTYFYHCHVDVAHHIDLGMYGAFIVEEVEPDHSFDREYVLMLDEWDNCHVHQNTDPIEQTTQSGDISDRPGCTQRFAFDNLAQNQATNTVRNPLCEQLGPGDPGYDELNCASHGDTPVYQTERGWYPVTHPLYKPEYNTWLINGKAFPDTVPIVGAEEETLKLRLINVGEQMHSMHLHGHNMLVTHRDGYQLEHPFRVDTLGIMPGERYDVTVEMDNPGFWAFHDHVGLHVMNDNHAPGGMFTCLAYDGFHGRDVTQFDTAIECIDEARAILSEMGAGHGDHSG